MITVSIEEKVDYYINLLKKNIKDYMGILAPETITLYNEDQIRKEIEKIVISEKDFMLTKAFMFYETKKSIEFQLLNYQDSLCYTFKDINTIVEDILVISGYLGSMGYNDEYHKYLDIINCDERKIFELLRRYQRIVYGYPSLPKRDKYISLAILQALAAYVYINKMSLDDLVKLFDDFVANIINRLDDVKLQIKHKYDERVGAYSYNYRELIIFLLYRLLETGEKVEKEIR